MSALELRSVSKHYPSGTIDLVALHDANLTVDAGEFVAITGPSGSGKSTLLNIAAGFDEVTSGAVLIGGEDLSAMNARQRTQFRQRALGFVFQAFHLFPELTVAENVGLPLLIGGRRDQRAVLELLESVGIADKAEKLPSALSGGEQQRVAVARALVNQPTLILADEPTGNLDSESGGTVADLLRSRARDANAALVVVTHNSDIAQLAGRVVTIRDGVLNA